MKKELINEIREEICDHICKYPAIFRTVFPDPAEAYATMLWDKCAECPLHKLEYPLGVNGWQE